MPDVYEPLLSLSGRVKFAELIEDELLLALPMVALHTPPQVCGGDQRGKVQPPARAVKTPRSKPFTALKTLKHR